MEAKKKSITLQQELHHRIKNNLSIVDSFVEIAISETKDTVAIENLQNLSFRIHSIYQVHEHVYLSPENSELNLKMYLDKLTTYIKAGIGKDNINVNSFIPKELKFPTEKTYVLGLIINEFLTNSFKHAYNANEEGDINISLEENRSQYKLLMSDTGKGTSDLDFSSKSKSYGIRLIHLLTKQLGGNIEMCGNLGCELLISLPK